MSGEISTGPLGAEQLTQIEKGLQNRDGCPLAQAMESAMHSGNAIEAHKQIMDELFHDPRTKLIYETSQTVNAEGTNEVVGTILSIGKYGDSHALYEEHTSQNQDDVLWMQGYKLTGSLKNPQATECSKTQEKTPQKPVQGIA